MAYATTQFRNVGADEMPISGFIGPQVSYKDYDGTKLPSLITDKSFSLLQEAGINLIMDQRVNYSNNTVIAKNILEMAEKYDISYFLPVSDAFTINSADDLTYGTVEEVEAIMQELYRYDSFAGFYFRDEPTSDMFSGITSAVSVFEQARANLGYSDLQVYLNMLPKLAGDRLSNGTQSSLFYYWTTYVKQYSQTGVDYLMFDSYPIVNEDQKDAQMGFINMMATINKQAKSDNKPWMGYVQTGGGKAAFSEEHKLVTQGEMNWNVYSMLAFGAKGISYYPLVTPPEMSNYGEDSYNQDSLLNIYGEKTPFYTMAQNVNKNIQKMDHILMNAAHEGVILKNVEITSRPYDGNDKVNSYRCLTGVNTAGSAIVGCFDYEGTVALLVVNSDIQNSGTVTLSFDNNYSYEVIQNAVSREIDGSNISLQLGAGECALIVVQ